MQRFSVISYQLLVISYSEELFFIIKFETSALKIMKRRDLLKGMATLPFLAQSVLSERRKDSNNKKLIKPKRLMKGDTVGVIAPSSSVTPEAFERAMQN